MHEQLTGVHQLLDGHRPLGVDQRRGRVVVLPLQLQRLLVQHDEAGRLRRRDVDVALIDAVGGDHEQQVADNQRRADRQVVREDTQFGDHVQLVNDLAVGGAVDDLTVVADVPEFLALDDGGGADALTRPVLDAADGQFRVGVLPQELAGLLVEAHQHALVDRLLLAGLGVEDKILGVARLLVIGADEHLAVGDDGAAV